MQMRVWHLHVIMSTRSLVQAAADPIAWPKTEYSQKYVLRRQIAERHLFGDGIEVGAKQAALLRPKDVEQLGLHVHLVDELPTESLLRKYGGGWGTQRNLSTKAVQQTGIVLPGQAAKMQRTNSWLTGIKAHPVDIVDNAATLRTFRNESLDFVIACHVLEHVPSFLGALQTFARVLRWGGVALIALPDKRFTTEDKHRNTTSPETHLREWHMDVAQLTSARIDHIAEAHGSSTKRAAQRLASSTGTHLYTFTTESIAQTLALARHSRFPMALVALEQAANENILVAQKVAGYCPAHTRFSKLPLPQSCPTRGTTSGRYVRRATKTDRGTRSGKLAPCMTLAGCTHGRPQANGGRKAGANLGAVSEKKTALRAPVHL